MSSLNNLLINLPHSTCNVILNYLYYSNSVYNSIKDSLYIIGNYPRIIMHEVLSYENRNNIDSFFYKSFLRWINLDVNKTLYEHIENNNPLDYDIQDKTRQIKIIIKIMNLMNIFQIQDFYNYTYHNT